MPDLVETAQDVDGNGVADFLDYNDTRTTTIRNGTGSFDFYLFAIMMIFLVYPGFAKARLRLY